MFLEVKRFLTEVKTKGGSMMRRRLVGTGIQKIGLRVFICAAILMLCGMFSHPVQGFDTGIKGLSIMGYINQTATYALHNNRPDNKDGFNSFLTQGLFETRYEASQKLVLFNSLKLNADWAYPIYSGSSEWREKGFSDSRDRLFVYDKFRDFVGEAHVTWKPNDQFFFRIGKQIIQWGETDGFLLMNQVNPVDQRRGIGDVQFENTIIPIWLVRAEYNPPIESTWLQNLNVQFIFDPNADFAKNQPPAAGNDVAGVWAPYLEIMPGVLGASYRDITSEPSQWSPQGQTFAMRVSGVVADSRITLNGYYGRSHELARSGLIGFDMEPFRWDPKYVLLHPWFEAYYPYFRFVGATFSRDIDFLKASALGGVAPVLRFEGLYAFNNTFSTNNNNAGQYMLEQGNNFWTSDEYRWMVGLDWKVKINALNPKAYFFISPQVYQRHIMDYPQIGHVGDQVGMIQYKDTWTTSLLINTSYLHTKLQPSLFWMRDWSNRWSMFKGEVAYEYSDKWKYTLGSIYVVGEKTGQGFTGFNYKDNVYVTVSYRF